MYGLEVEYDHYYYVTNCEYGDDVCMEANCIYHYGEEVCAEYYGEDDSDSASCDDGDDYCQCVEAIGEEACAEFYGGEEDELCEDGDVSCYEAMCIEENGEDFCAQFYG